MENATQSTDVAATDTSSIDVPDEDASESDTIEDDPAQDENKKTHPELYRPPRALPQDKNGKPVPDVDTPHTQLGEETSKRTGEKYRQTREWGDNGEPTGRVDWTDHGYPKNHTDPHFHPNTPNPTGGTPKIGETEPFIK